MASMRNRAFVGVGALALAAPSGADFTGIAVNESIVGDKMVADVYATFSSNPEGAVDVLLNVFNVDMEFSQGFGAFIHNDFVGGSWAPQFSSNPAMDTFCVIGGEANFGNSTNADPNWGPAGFNQIPIPPLAGWFNSNPPNLQGKAREVALFDACGSGTYSGFATRIMRLVFNFGSPQASTLTLTGAYTNNKGLGTPAEQGTFNFSENLGGCIPAPAAMASIGLAALVGVRRRRA